jgi:hypothetical protein
MGGSCFSLASAFHRQCYHACRVLRQEIIIQLSLTQSSLDVVPFSTTRPGVPEDDDEELEGQLFREYCAFFLFDSDDSFE